MRVVLLTAFLLITGFISIALKAFLFLKPENFTREILVSNERGDNGYIRGLNNRNRGYNVIPPMEKRKTSVPCWTRVIRRLNTVLRAITLETGLNFFFYHGIAFTRSVSHVGKTSLPERCCCDYLLAIPLHPASNIFILLHNFIYLSGFTYTHKNQRQVLI